MENKIYYRRSLPHIQPLGATFFVTFRLAGSLPKEVILQLKEEQLENEKFLQKIKDEKERQKRIADQRKRYFGKFDEVLDKATNGPYWLKDERVAKVVADAIHFRDKKEYDLLAYCIMPNHVHLVFTVGQISDFPMRNTGSGSCETPFRTTGSCETSFRTTTVPIGDWLMRNTASRYIVTDVLQSLKRYTAMQANKILNRTGAFWQHESYDHVVRDGKELERIIHYVINNPVKAGLVTNAEDWKWSYHV